MTCDDRTETEETPAVSEFKLSDAAREAGQRVWDAADEHACEPLDDAMTEAARVSVEEATEKLRAENERLRNALEDIVDKYGDPGMEEDDYFRGYFSGVNEMADRAKEALNDG